MSGELEYPPRTAMPDDVRARMRETVNGGIRKPRRTARIWYAAAAAVVFVASGAVAATQTLHKPTDVSPPAPAAGGLTLDSALATSLLDRCWAAAVATGKGDRVPARENWIPLFTEVREPISVVAAVAASKPMFCETTKTTVTLSDPTATPAYAPGTQTGLLLHSGTGLVAGVVDPAWPSGYVEYLAPNGLSGQELYSSSPVTRQFVSFTGTNPAKTQLALNGWRGNGAVSLPPAPAPLFSMVDHPVPDGDRTSPAGRALGDCLSGSTDAVPDAPGYRPVTLVEEDGYRAVLGRQGDDTLVCTVEPDPKLPGRTKMRAYVDLYLVPPLRPHQVLVSTLGAVWDGGEPGKARTAFAGVLPSTAVTMTYDFGGGINGTSTVVEGTFLVLLPKGFAPQGGANVQARDANGTVVFDGPL